MDEVKKFNTNIENLVVMHNDLIRGKSTLSLNEVKLLRIAIMQVLKDDTDFQTYEVSVQDLGQILGIAPDNIYRDIRKMCKHLLMEIVDIWDGNPRHDWESFQWCSKCRYSSVTGKLTIRLHDDLKPYLIGLSKLYTKYMLHDVLMLKTVYGVRIYEVIRSKMMNNEVYGNKTVSIKTSIDELRTATNTENKYPEVGHWKERVLAPAVEDIRKRLGIHIDIDPIKEGRKFIGYNLTLSKESYHRMTDAEKMYVDLKSKSEPVKLVDKTDKPKKPIYQTKTGKAATKELYNADMVSLAFKIRDLPDGSADQMAAKQELIRIYESENGGMDSMTADQKINFIDACNHSLYDLYDTMLHD